MIELTPAVAEDGRKDVIGHDRIVTVVPLKKKLVERLVRAPRLALRLSRSTLLFIYISLSIYPPTYQAIVRRVTRMCACVQVGYNSLKYMYTYQTVAVEDGIFPAPFWNYFGTVRLYEITQGNKTLATWTAK